MSAAEHLREAIDVGCARDDHDHIADHRAEVIAERDAQIIAWLTKKAAEEGTSNKDSRVRATAIYRLADKLSRGAVRPPLSKGLEPLLAENERQFLTFALELAADQMASRGDEFDDDDEDALNSLQALAANTPAAVTA